METALPNLYDYRSVRRYLLDFLAARQKEDSQFSMRRWAKEMGLGANALLVLLLQGKRPIRLQHSAFLCKGLPLSSPEKLYLRALIQFENATTPEEKELCSLWLSELHPGQGFRIKEIEEYQIVAHWVHSALMALTELARFDGTPECAHRLLAGRVPLPEIRAALERLEDMGYLKRLPDGRVAATYPETTTRDDVPNTAVRTHQKEMLAVAADAIESVPLDAREFRTASFVAPRSRVALAKDMIRKFQAQLVRAMTEPSGPDDPEEVYQFNVQLFQLTECRGQAPKDEGVVTEHPLSHAKG